MKKTLVACSAAALLMTTVSAHAIGVNAQIGQHYTNLGVGFGTTTPGLALSGNWAHSDNDGDVAGVGLGYNIALGPVMATVGGKALYTHPKDGDEGYAIPVGGGLQLPLGRYVSLYGEGYYAPDSLSSGVNNYKEANGGVRFTPISLVTVDVGYRYQALEGKDGHRDNIIADGAYIGGAVNF
ncbi:YfaZ family outer membrane protein [Rouxiella chamberiensis]|uniref:YfaZ family outer membrane protein n=1 Tax=Rouxiella chamberiensis TaxID=1513468 RepID=A0ABY7HRG4_9GAMM|nr:YfaZ family outer membrane protein [Rouxiella chamberiensis]WAT01607.1 YfaZ family outer membrane protein [Rouxiella chamberiensis]